MFFSSVMFSSNDAYTSFGSPLLELFLVPPGRYADRLNFLNYLREIPSAMGEKIQFVRNFHTGTSVILEIMGDFPLPVLFIW